MKAKLRKTGEVVELKRYYSDGTAMDINGKLYHQGDIAKLFEDTNSKGLEYEFEQLGRTKKCEFISQHVDLASPEAIAKYVKGYLFDVLKDVDDDEYIATYLRNKGYKVEGNIEQQMENIKLLYIDLFCGAGGTSTGVEHARNLLERIRPALVEATEQLYR